MFGSRPVWWILLFILLMAPIIPFYVLSIGTNKTQETLDRIVMSNPTALPRLLRKANAGARVFYNLLVDWYLEHVIERILL